MDTDNFDEIFLFLKRNSVHIGNLTRKLLFKNCQYGANLDKFYTLFSEKKRKGEISTSFCLVVKNEFNISDRYGRKLRWLRCLWQNYPKIGFLSLTLNDLFRREKEINDLFTNYPAIAEEWKEQNVDGELSCDLSTVNVSSSE